MEKYICLNQYICLYKNKGGDKINIKIEILKNLKFDIFRNLKLPELPKLPHM